MPGSGAPERRIVAIVVPELLCEIAAEALLALQVGKAGKRAGPLPLGVVLVDGEPRGIDVRAETASAVEAGTTLADFGASRSRSAKERRVRKPGEAGRMLIDSTQASRGGDAETRSKIKNREALAPSALDAANPVAQSYGVRAGQSIAEARVLVSRLVVREVSRKHVLFALGRIAEVALAFGVTAAIEAPDTVWLDITGAAHLVGGERALVQELSSRVRAMGHVVRVAVSSGPLLARAFARWAEPAGHGASSHDEDSLEGLVIPSVRTVEALAPLPISALPLSVECITWLMRVGVFTIEDLAALPRTAAGARLGPNASQVLDLCEGRDPAPLTAYVPPRVIQEENLWDEPVTGYEPLRFVLRGLVARLSARLSARGLSVQRLVVTIEYDRSIARLQGAETATVQKFKLAAPLWKEEDLGRVIGSRLERLKLKAPSIGLRVEASAVVPAVARQLDLSQVSGGLTTSRGDEELPVLLAELYADIGQSNVGVLRVLDAHRPESRSGLFTANVEPSSSEASAAKRRRAPESSSSATTTALYTQVCCEPTRLLPEPARLDAALRVGVTVAIDRRLYTIGRLAFEQRLDTVEWWSERAVSRDYVRLWLEGAEGGLEALVFVDRETGERYLQAIAD